MSTYRIRMEAVPAPFARPVSWASAFGGATESRFWHGCWCTTNPKEARTWGTQHAAKLWLSMRCVSGSVEPVLEAPSLKQRLRAVTAERDEARAQLAAVLAAKPPQKRKSTKSKKEKKS